MVALCHAIASWNNKDERKKEGTTVNYTARMAIASVMLVVSTAASVSAADECGEKRKLAWAKYSSCVEKVLGKFYGAESAPFANPAWVKCRAKFFKAWESFQGKAALAGTACDGSRFTDHGDGSVTDNLTGLTWAQKDDSGGIHDKDNTYTWSTGEPWLEDGTAYSDYLATLNSTTFAGSSGWRLPSFVELQTLILDYPCKGDWFAGECPCSADPCVTSAIGTPSGGLHMSSTTWPEFPNTELDIIFTGGGWSFKLFCANPKECPAHVIAVRGGI